MSSSIKKNDRVVVIGNGIAGITFARNLRKSNSEVSITIISGESQYFFSRPALMYLYMGQMKFENTKPYEDWFWAKNNFQLIHAWVENIDLESKKVICSNGHQENYDFLIVATGSTPRKLRVEGIDLIGVQGFYGLADLDLMEKSTKSISHAVVVGGGLVGIELVEMLLTRKIKVTYLIREAYYFGNVLPEAEAKLLTQLIQSHGVDARLSIEIERLEGDVSGHVVGVHTTNGAFIQCDWVGIAVGVQPNISFLKNSRLETNVGVLVNKYFESNHVNVYAIGDCAEFKEALEIPRGNIEQTWYTGRMHGETLAFSLAKEKTAYSPGVWFNSAKFFTTEYLTYGHVPVMVQEPLRDFYWESSEKDKAFRIVYEGESGRVLGVHSLGWRIKHQFFDRAISEQWTFEKVMRQLHKADFDPEFYKSISKEVVKNYSNGSVLKNKSVKSLRTIFKNWF
jgi:NAD(P)H-nitrite reductase large subunit